MWFLQLVDPIDYLFYHEVLMDLRLRWTSICQDSWVNGASLHPSLFSQSIKGGVITKLGLHNVREAVKEQNNKGYYVRYQWVWSIEEWVMSNGSWATGLRLWVYWMRQQHLDLTLSIHRAVRLVGPSTWRVSSGSMLEVASVAGASGSFDNFSPKIKGFWQWKPIGRGVLQTHR